MTNTKRYNPTHGGPQQLASDCWCPEPKRSRAGFNKPRPPTAPWPQHLAAHIASLLLPELPPLNQQVDGPDRSPPVYTPASCGGLLCLLAFRAGARKQGHRIRPRDGNSSNCGAGVGAGGPEAIRQAAARRAATESGGGTHWELGTGWSPRTPALPSPSLRLEGSVACRRTHHRGAEGAPAQQAEDLSAQDQSGWFIPRQVKN